MRHSNYLSNFFSEKIAKHEEYRTDNKYLLKNDKNAKLTYNLTRFNEVVSCKWLWILCSLLDNDVILFYIILKS